MSSDNLPDLITSTFKSLSKSPSTDSPADFAGGPKDLARYIDHTLLRVGATEEEVIGLCEEAKVWGFRTVCVRLAHVALAVHELRGTNTGVACVIGFHEGTQSTAEKVGEARAALEQSATELDVVLDHQRLLTSLSLPSDSELPSATSWSPSPLSEIHAQLLAIRALSPIPTSTSPTHDNENPPATLKLILETSQLSTSNQSSHHSLITAATLLAHHANFDFVKTSTGFCGHGAKVEDVAFMKKVCAMLADSGRGGNGRRMKVKASGGIRTLEDALGMIEAGAERLGVSAGVAIVKALKARQGRGPDDRGDKEDLGKEHVSGASRDGYSGLVTKRE